MKHSAKQLEALALLHGPARYVMLYGGTRSGKTRVYVEWLMRACWYFPGLRVLCARFRRKHAKDTLWHETILSEVLPTQEPGIEAKESDLMLRYPQGSELWVVGTDDKARVEAILGRGVGALYFNEASQISYDAFTMGRTRLAQVLSPNHYGIAWRHKCLVDCNPPGPGHWTHRVFLDHIEPRNGKRLNPEQYVALQINPMDNAEFLPPGFIESLDDLPELERMRFKLGMFVRPGGIVFRDFGPECLFADDAPCERWVVGVDLVTYAAVLIGLSRYRRKDKIRHRAWVQAELRDLDATSHGFNERMRESWGRYGYRAYIDHNLGPAGTREFDNAMLAAKGPGSLEAGVRLIQGMLHMGELRIHQSCTALQYEIENYRRDDDGVLVEEDDHLIAALRYALFSAIGKGRTIEAS
jgi:hypothetical protein